MAPKSLAPRSGPFSTATDLASRNRLPAHDSQPCIQRPLRSPVYQTRTGPRRSCAEDCPATAATSLSRCKSRSREFKGSRAREPNANAGDRPWDLARRNQDLESIPNATYLFAAVADRYAVLYSAENSEQVVERLEALRVTQSVGMRCRVLVSRHLYNGQDATVSLIRI